MEKISGIYIIFNRINKKKYIGSSGNIFKRWTTHKSLLSQNKHSNRYLQAAWNKYGKENFKFSILEKVELIKEKLLEREQFWLDKLLTYNREKGYNSRIQAESNLGFKYTEEMRKNHPRPFLGRKHSEETKKKQSQAKRGISKNPEHIEKIASQKRGKKLSQESIIKRTNTRRTRGGFVFSEEHKRKISEAQRGLKSKNFGKKQSPEIIKKRLATRYKNKELKILNRDNYYEYNI